ncbi:MAG: hypothetical protein CK425_04185 [Parachlamydia sp.]|nr:MAG: hypothetical protein CK425_04185 [Parachlamydia sp.]
MAKPNDFAIGPQGPSPQHIPNKHVNIKGISVERTSKSEVEVTPPAKGSNISPPAEKVTVELPSEALENENLAQFAEAVEQVDLYMQLGTLLSSKPTPTFREWIRENREIVVQDLLQAPQETHLDDSHEGDLKDLPPRLLNQLAKQGLLEGVEHTLDEETIYAGLVHLLPDTSKKSLQYYRQEMFQELSLYVEDLQQAYKNAPNPELKDKIVSLEHWLKKNRFKSGTSLLMKTEKAFITTGVALRTPLLLLSRAMGYLRYLDAIGGVATLGAGNVLKLGVKIFDLARTIQHKRLQKKWQKEYHQPKAVVDHTTPAGQEQAKVHIEKLLEKRKAEDLRKFTDARPQFYFFLRTLAKDAQSIEEIRTSLSAKGIHLEEIEGVSFDSLDSLKYSLSTLTVKEKLLEAYVKNQDAIQLSVRNAIKTCETSKILRIQGELNRKFRFDVVNVALTAVLGATIIVLNVLIITSILTVPQFALPILGVSFLIAAVVVGAVGLIYFYRNNPHRFKEMVKGVNLNLAVYQIPSAYRNYFLKRKQKKQQEELALTYALRVKIREIEAYLKQYPINSENLPKKLQPLVQQTEKKISPVELQRYRDQLLKLENLQRQKLEHLEQAREKRAAKIYRLEKKVEYWKAKKGPLQARLKYAGVADFLRANHLQTDKKGNPLDVSKIIAEGALTNPKLLDRETLQVLDRLYGIDIEKMRAEGDPNIKERIAEQLDIYFSKTPAQFLKFVKKRMLEIKDEENGAKIFQPDNL